MTYAAHMRIGSLEIVTALAAVALIASRPRAFGTAEGGALVPVRIALRILELGRERSFEGLCPLTIGRDRSAELVLADPEVSRAHARLETSGDGVYLRDLRSSNGTYLNGRRIDAAIEVLEGDAIDVGGTRITIARLGSWT